MAATTTTKTAKDGASSPQQFPLDFIDLSGNGSGPFAPTHAVRSSAGALVNPATAENQATANAALQVLATAAQDATATSVTLTPYGLGSLSAVPGASANGTPLGSPPIGKRGARLYVPPNGSITFTIAAAQPTSAPSATITVANPSANTIPANWDEDLAGTQMIYVTAATGSPLFRWY